LENAQFERAAKLAHDFVRKITRRGGFSCISICSQSGTSATTVRRLRAVSSVVEHLVYTELRAILVA